MSSIKDHYERLRQDDPKRWGEFNGKLSSVDSPNGDCYTYFKRSIIGKEEKGGHVNLAVTYLWIVDLMVEYLGFTWEEIRANKRPELPTLSPVE